MKGLANLALLTLLAGIPTAELGAQGLLQPGSIDDARYQVTLWSVVRPGDLYEGYPVEQIHDLSINDRGDWVVIAEVDHPDLSRDLLVIRNGAVVAQEGDLTSTPSAALLNNLDAVAIEQHRLFSLSGTLSGTANPPFDDHAVFLNGVLLAQEGNLVNATEFGNGTTYGNMFDAKFNDGGSVLLNGYFNDPDTGFLDYALVRIDPALTTAHLIVKTGEVLPGNPTWTVRSPKKQPEDTEFNNLGEAIFVVDFYDPLNTQAIYWGDEGGLVRVAQQNLPSPVPGDPYKFFSQSGVALNDCGGYAFQATLQSNRSIIVRSNQLLVGEGDAVVGRPGETVHDLGTFAPIQISNNDRVLYVAKFGPGNPFNRDGLFLNRDLIVEVSETRLQDGTVVNALDLSSNAYEMSPNGDWILFEATLQSGPSGTAAVIARITERPSAFGRLW
jgi:hypothetical protein